MFDTPTAADRSGPAPLGTRLRKSAHRARSGRARRHPGPGRSRALLTASLLAVALSAASAGPMAAIQGPETGVVLIAHGGSENWNARVHDLAGDVELGGPLEVSFLMGPHAAEHRFQDVVASLEAEGAERIVVVPVLASSHSGHYEQLRYLVGETDELSEMMHHHLHEAGIHRPATETPLLLTPSLDASMELAPILADRALSLADDPDERALFLVGHGPNSAENHALWMANLRPVADSVARLSGFADVHLGMLRDDAPDPVREEAVRGIREVIDLQHALTDRPVVVVPILISKGYISTQKLPADLEGLPIAYDGEGVLPHPQMARWVERRVREAVETAAEPEGMVGR